MNIFLRDHAQGSSNWPSALKTHFPGVLIGGDNDAIPTDATLPRLILLHTKDAKVRSAWKKWVASSEQHFLVIVGSGGRISNTEDDRANRIYGNYWSSAEFKSASIARIRSFINEMKNGCFKPAFLRPPPTEHLLALRLLCESWLLVHWNEGPEFSKRLELAKALQVDTASYKLPEGIQLTPPNSADTWIVPFGEGSVDSIVNETTSEEARDDIRSFFTDMSRALPDFTRVASLFLLLDALVKSSN